MAPYSVSLTQGTVLHSPERDYRVVKVLGQGGFGITYLVEGDVKVGNITARVKFAVKEHFMAQLCDRDQGTHAISYSKPVAETVTRSLQSFVKEANRLHTLGISHPNIVKINEVFEANNTAYYVMEYLDGETLAAYVRRQGRLSADETEYFMRPLIEAVAALQRARLAHYDIKPENIILSRGNDDKVRAVLIDFGLAKHYDSQGQATSTLSTSGYSPGYAPMEQYAGLREFSPASDVYSLGATMYFCLTGHDPAEAFAVRSADLRDELSQVADPALADAIAHAMQLQRDDRPADAAAMLAETYGGVRPVIKSRPTENFKTTPQAEQSVPTVVKPVSPVADRQEPQAEVIVEPKRNNARYWAIGGGIAALVFAGLLLWPSDSDNATQTDQSALQTDTVAAADLKETFAKVINDSRQPADKPAETTGPAVDDDRNDRERQSPASRRTNDSDDPTTRPNSTRGEGVKPEPTQPAPKPDRSYIFSSVEEKPVFPGGEASMYRWIADNLRYPQSAVEAGVQGRVLVTFDIMPDGRVANARIARSRYPALDQEALRLVNSMPAWSPGKVGGNPVKVEYSLPVTFKFD